MKIGILTFHNAHNFGAMLQAFALKKKIRQFGHEVEIINYCNQNIDKRYGKRLKVKIGKGDIKHPRRLILKIQEHFDNYYKQPAWTRQCEKFQEFMYTYLLENNKKKISIKELEETSYDAIIVGSDQIWESWITGGLDDAYLLNFRFKGRRIAYAGSRFGTSIPQEEIKLLKQCLNKFEYISVREEPLKEILSHEIDKDISCVLDPTLLLKGEDYLEILKEPNHCMESYVFAYFVVEDKILMECAEYIAKEKGIKLIELHYYMQKELKSHNQIADIGPNEFLGYIKSAELVLTNSFHGTVFSILFHKNFYSICKNNMRIENLLATLGLEKCCIYNKSMINDIYINFEHVEAMLENKRKESIQFLEKALEKNE